MDPDPNWIRMQQLYKSRSVFRIWIRNYKVKNKEKSLDGLKKIHYLNSEQSSCDITFKKYVFQRIGTSIIPPPPPARPQALDVSMYLL